MGTFARSDFECLKSIMLGIEPNGNFEKDDSMIMNDLLENIPGGIAIYRIGENAETLFVSEGVARLMGLTIEEYKELARGDMIKNTVYEDDVHMVKAYVEKSREKKSQLSITNRVKHKDGRPIWIHFSATYVGNDSKGKIYYAIYTRPATETALYLNLLNDSTTAVIVQEVKNRNIIFANKAWKRLAKISDDINVIGSSIYDFFEEKGFIYSTSDVSSFSPDFYKESRRIDNNGRMLKAYSKFINWNGIDAFVSYINDETELWEIQRAKEANYEEKLSMKKILASNEKAVGVLNLTKDTITDSESADEEVNDRFSATTAEGTFEEIRKYFVSVADLRAHRHIFNRQAILENYKKGVTHRSLSHLSKDLSRYLESSYDIVVNPYTSDVEAIAVLRDITDKVRSGQIIDSLMKIDYDSIFTIDASTGEVTPFSKNDTQTEVPSVLKNLDPNLIFIKSHLEKEATYSTVYSINSDHKFRHKRIIYAYIDEYKQTILCAVQDLTNAYEKEEEQRQALSQALEKAEMASKAKTEFFSRMSHDMRTPMNGILGLAELSVEENDVDVLKHNISKIKESGEYLLSLINDTLDFQRIESGRMVLEPQVINSKEFAASIKDLIAASAEEKNIDLRFINRNVDLGWYLRIDPVRLKQIFFNLLSNAIKFTPEGGIVTVELDCIGTDDLIAHDIIRISDTGVGMSREFLQNEIFKPFSQEYNDISNQYAGTGLGLSIVKKLVELMKGKIEVTSELGVGTSFTVKLDLKRVPEDDAVIVSKVDEKHQLEIKNRLMGKRILLVEDHPLNAEIAIRMLEKVGCEVTWKNNGQLALECFEKVKLHYFDAILMDIRMPVMNGLETTRAIRKLNRKDATNIPIIAMTANAYDEDVKQSIDSGMNAHLAKPIEPMKMFEMLSIFINQKKF